MAGCRGRGKRLALGNLFIFHLLRGDPMALAVVKPLIGTVRGHANARRAIRKLGDCLQVDGVVVPDGTAGGETVYQIQSIFRLKKAHLGTAKSFLSGMNAAFDSLEEEAV